MAVHVLDGVFHKASLHPTFDALLADAQRAEVIGVDIPIGLVDAGIRECDAAARTALGPRWLSVFMTPPRAALYANDYADAQRLAVEATGKSVSKQAYALAAKIREVAEHAGDGRLYEVHPEISFLTMAGGALPRKKTWAGLRERLAILHREGIQLPAELGPAGTAAADDIADAAAAAWSALRIARGQAATFPSPVSQYDGPRPIAIWA